MLSSQASQLIAQAGNGESSRGSKQNWRLIGIALGSLLGPCQLPTTPGRAIDSPAPPGAWTRSVTFIWNRCVSVLTSTTTGRSRRPHSKAGFRLQCSSGCQIARPPGDTAVRDGGRPCRPAGGGCAGWLLSATATSGTGEEAFGREACRERMREHCGTGFGHVRGSAFEHDSEAPLEPVWAELQAHGISP